MVKSGRGRLRVKDGEGKFNLNLMAKWERKMNFTGFPSTYTVATTVAVFTKVSRPAAKRAFDLCNEVVDSSSPLQNTSSKRTSYQSIDVVIESSAQTINM